MNNKSKPNLEPVQNLKALEASYYEIEPLANRLGDEIKHQLEQLLLEKNVVLGIPIQRRTKSWSSIREKVERKSLTINSPRDLHDLVGLRIIVQFLKDLVIVQDLIRNNFDVLEEYNTENRLKEDQFGYNSIHFVVEVPSAWLAVPTLSAMKGLRTEIQLRTTAQHIWAAASHTLQYKIESSVPIPIRRAIHRVSALLETVDLEFDRVLQERADYRASISDTTEDRRLNVDLIEEILDSVFPVNHKTPQEPYEELMEELEHIGVNSSKKLIELLKKHRQEAMDQDAKIVEILRTSKRPESEKYAYEPERLSLGVFFSHVGLARAALEEEYGEDWHQKNEI